MPEASCLPPREVAGIADVNANVTSNGQTAHVQGTIDASQLKLAANGSPAPRPVHVNFTVNQNLASLSGQLQNTTLAFGKALFKIAGTYQTHGAKTNLNVTAATQGAPINDLEAFLPSLGIQMPSGSKLQGGTLTTTLAITGTSDAPVISGPVRLDNTQLAGFDLGSKMAAVTALTGGKTGNVTTVRVLSLNLREAGGALDAQNILLDVTGLGTATGNGNRKRSQGPQLPRCGQARSDRRRRHGHHRALHDRRRSRRRGQQRAQERHSRHHHRHGI